MEQVHLGETRLSTKVGSMANSGGLSSRRNAGRLSILGVQEGNWRLARKPPKGESSNVIVPS